MPTLVHCGPAIINFDHVHEFRARRDQAGKVVGVDVFMDHVDPSAGNPAITLTAASGLDVDKLWAFLVAGKSDYGLILAGDSAFRADAIRLVVPSPHTKPELKSLTIWMSVAVWPAFSREVTGSASDDLMAAVRKRLPRPPLKRIENSGPQSAKGPIG